MTELVKVRDSSSRVEIRMGSNPILRKEFRTSQQKVLGAQDVISMCRNRHSSVVERSALNRSVEGSTPSGGGKK